jgi:aldehyde dehydrogenase (NAD+)
VIAPLILADANVNMPIMRADHFGPAAAIVAVTSEEEALQLNAKCPYALGASVFSGNESRAQDLAGRISAGSVVINDVIVPTADPRLPFGGRGESGYGVMRGAEGLLELTVPKVVVTHQGSLRRHLEPPSARQAEVLTQFLKLTHAPSWRRRLNAAWRLIRAERNSKHT